MVSVVGFMSLHCGCGRVIEAAMRKLVSCPQHCHMATLGSHWHCSVTPLTFVSYREAGSVRYCSLMEHRQEILFIQINGMLLKHHY